MVVIESGRYNSFILLLLLNTPYSKVVIVFAQIISSKLVQSENKTVDSFCKLPA